MFWYVVFAFPWIWRICVSWRYVIYVYIIYTVCCITLHIRDRLEFRRCSIRDRNIFYEVNVVMSFWLSNYHSFGVSRKSKRYISSYYHFNYNILYIPVYTCRGRIVPYLISYWSVKILTALNWFNVIEFNAICVSIVKSVAKRLPRVMYVVYINSAIINNLLLWTYIIYSMICLCLLVSCKI